VLSNHSRNLTDRQFEAIGETGGMVGGQLRGELPAADGRHDRDTPASSSLIIVEHMRRRSEDGVRFGLGL